jgi:hypothetical protein
MVNLNPWYPHSKANKTKGCCTCGLLLNLIECWTCYNLTHKLECLNHKPKNVAFLWLTHLHLPTHSTRPNVLRVTQLCKQ